MSPLWLPPNTFGPTQTNLTVTDRDGTTVTAGATAHTKGAWVELVASASEDAYAITLRIRGVSVAAAVTNYLLDIGIGPAGSEQVVVQNLCASAAPALAGRTGKLYCLPLRIPKGSRVAARSQATVASDVAEVSLFLHQAAQGWGMDVPVQWEGLGLTLTTSQGTSVTPGLNAFGISVTIVASTAKDYDWWIPGFDQLADTTTTDGDFLLRLLGPGATFEIGQWGFATNTVEEIPGPWPPVPVHLPIPAGSEILAGLAGAATEARGVSVYAGVRRGF